MRRWSEQILLQGLVWTAGVGAAACADADVDSALIAQVAKLERDTRALAETVAEAKAGQLIRPDNVIVTIHERAVLDLFEAVLPLETSFPGRSGFGSVRARIERASVLFDGGLGTVNVDGRAWLESWPSVAAEVHLSGGLSEARIDPHSRLLHARVGLDVLDVKLVPGGMLSKLLRGRLIVALNATGREEITEILPPLQFPLKVDHRLEIPPVVKDPVHVPGASVEVTVAVTRMFATGNRLWVQLEPRMGQWRKTGAPP